MRKGLTESAQQENTMKDEQTFYLKYDSTSRGQLFDSVSLKVTLSGWQVESVPFLKYLLAGARPYAKVNQIKQQFADEASLLKFLDEEGYNFEGWEWEDTESSDLVVFNAEESYGVIGTDKSAVLAKFKELKSQGMDDDDFHEESKQEDSMKEAKDEVVDLMGATKQTLNNMVKFYNFAQDEAKKTMIDAKDLWKYLIKSVKTEAKISDFALVKAGMPVPMVMEVLGEAEPKELAYKTLILTMDDGSTKSIVLDEVLPKIAPFAKQFKSPIEALVMGNPEGILKVMQKVFGKNVTQWSIPAAAEAISMDFLSALVLSEMYNLGKFGKESALVEKVKVEDKTTMQLKSDAAEMISDAFDKSDKQYVVNLFPNVLPDYPMQLVQEAQTVLNTLSTDEMDKLWPNINREYLVNLKEDELQKLADRMNENCGMDHKKAKKKVEAAPKLNMPTLKLPAGWRGGGACGGTRRQDGSGGGQGNVGTAKQPAKKNRRSSFGAPAQAGATFRGVGRRGRSV